MHNRQYVKLVLTCMALAAIAIACRASAGNELFFGKTDPPPRDILRYVTGDEPESLDPQVSTGQPEGRIYMALYEGLAEYDPKTTGPIPALAERWHVNKDSSEFVFHLRRNARWSNGDPITANDFVYSFRRGLSPELAARNANLAYYIKYAQAYNGRSVFVGNPRTGEFLFSKDFEPDAQPAPPLSQTLLKSPANEYEPAAAELAPDADTPFHQFMHSPERLTLPRDETSRNKLLARNPRLQAAVARMEFIPVRAEDIGVEAVDDFTVRITLSQSAPFFVGLMPNQFFRLVPQKVIEKYGERWTDPAHIVTCGPFKLKSWRPYDSLVVERDPMYWDAAKVRLEEIRFYPMLDNPMIMNLYKVGDVDAVLNHTVPYFWLDVVRAKKDYMDGAEAAISYVIVNVTKPPVNDVRVRRAFNLAIDKVSYSTARKTTKPLTAFTPEGIFPGYPQPKGDAFNPERARQLLAEAGYPVTQRADGSYECKNFPADQVEYTFNTQSSNRTMAEFLQAQWKQNLGITVPLRSMEFRTYLNLRNKLEYKGFALGLWGADYMDPFTFLNIFYAANNDSGTGWSDPKYTALLDEANRTLDEQKRYELLGRAEKYLLDAQPILPVETLAVNFVKKPYVKGMYPNPGSMYPWKFVYIERDPAKWDYASPSLVE